MAPDIGQLGTAPDGTPALAAVARGDIVVISFVSDRGLFIFDPRALVTCRVWIGKQVKWAGFYFQDYEHQHHAQWHLPLDRRGAWRELSFRLGDVVGANGPVMAAGDTTQYFMLQAQFAPDAELYLDQVVVHAPAAATP